MTTIDEIKARWQGVNLEYIEERPVSNVDSVFVRGVDTDHPALQSELFRRDDVYGKPQPARVILIEQPSRRQRIVLDLAAHAPTDIAFLLAELERTRAENERQRGSAMAADALIYAAARASEGLSTVFTPEVEAHLRRVVSETKGAEK